MTTALAILLIVVVMIAPHLLQRYLPVVASPQPLQKASPSGETVIRLNPPTSNAARIELAETGVQSRKSEHDDLRARGIALINKYPDRGTRVIRGWMSER